DLRPPWPEILRRAAMLEGFPRHLSVHCGGVVLVPDEVSRYVPVQLAAKGVRIIQWEKDQAEEAGLVKIDLLGNRSLAVIRDSLAAVEENSGTRIVYERFNPLEDLRTRELVRDGDTIGVFYVESPAMRQLQQKTRCGDFEHLVIHSSLIRPAANDYIREYVRRLRGGSYTPLHPILDRVLGETYGIMCYQEDVARVAIEMAGFDDAEADGLRKVLSKKWAGRRLEDLSERFHAGAARRGITPRVAGQVWEMILSFSGYSFCKAHSASYAMVSFKSAYLKAHYPAEFLAAVISNGGGYYSAFAYISEARRMGLDILLPDVNESERRYTGRDRALRVGLMQVKSMREESLAAIVRERNRAGPFLSFDEFLKRVAIDPSDVKLLIRAGAIDSIAGRATRPDLIWRLHRWTADRKSRKGEVFFFAADGPAILPRGPRYSPAKVLRDEIKTLGFLVSRHPLALYRGALAALDHVPAIDLAKHAGKRVRTIGWLITGKVVETKRGEPMEFLSFEDTTAIYETTFFPRAYARFCNILTTTRPFLLEGRVDEDFGAVTLTVENARLLGISEGIGKGSNRCPVTQAGASRPAGMKFG
ncbi:MAG: DNA polymerase III subunit alpha, partial [Acidobacteria bacterium]|nr:DNA polymerase III subunit alpha [Acidobacteriota bacterium]